jgi:hypothetical protein
MPENQKQSEDDKLMQNDRIKTADQNQHGYQSQTEYDFACGGLWCRS